MLSFQELLDRIETQKFSSVNDENGDWSLKPIEDTGITMRPEPTDEEMTRLRWGDFAVKSSAYGR